MGCASFTWAKHQSRRIPCAIRSYPNRLRSPLSVGEKIGFRLCLKFHPINLLFRAHSQRRIHDGASRTIGPQIDFSHWERCLYSEKCDEMLVTVEKRIWFESNFGKSSRRSTTITETMSFHERSQFSVSLAKCSTTDDLAASIPNQSCFATNTK